MYPVLFRIGSFEITSFGVMVALGSLVGYWLFARDCRCQADWVGRDCEGRAKIDAHG